MNSSATITISKLRIYAHHGLLPQERMVGNWFEVSLSVSFPCPAIDTDCIEHTLNYAQLTELIHLQMQIPSNLMEHVAGRIAGEIRRQFPQVTHGNITITKLTPPITALQCAGISVTISL